MSNIAIITARGGSKRIPRKNIREFCGKPIIAYSIEAALKSDVFDEVMVSTDDEEIAKISKKYGANVPFMRSEKTSNDFAGTSDVLSEVLTEYKKRDRDFSIMCCIYPTAPFITSEKLENAYHTLRQNNALMVMPVVAFSYPPQRAMIKEDSGKLKYIYPEKYESRSQDLERWFHDAGQFYYYDINSFTQSKGKILSGIYPIEVSEMEVQDIDNEEDWKVAEIKYKKMIENRDIIHNETK